MHAHTHTHLSRDHPWETAVPSSSVPSQLVSWEQEGEGGTSCVSSWEEGSGGDRHPHRVETGSDAAPSDGNEGAEGETTPPCPCPCPATSPCGGKGGGEAGEKGNTVLP